LSPSSSAIFTACCPLVEAEYLLFVVPFFKRIFYRLLSPSWSTFFTTCFPHLEAHYLLLVVLIVEALEDSILEGNQQGTSNCNYRHEEPLKGTFQYMNMRWSNTNSTAKYNGSMALQFLTALQQGGGMLDWKSQRLAGRVGENAHSLLKFQTGEIIVAAKKWAIICWAIALISSNKDIIVWRFLAH
jgi:hypothetical protein